MKHLTQLLHALHIKGLASKPEVQNKYWPALILYKPIEGLFADSQESDKKIYGE